MQYYVYIMANQRNTVLNIGVTSDLEQRVWQHKNKVEKGFTNKYNVEKLVYYEVTTDVNSAIAREKQLKGWRREKKNLLIQTLNPNFEELVL